ncbi:MAG: hypothetical protein V5B78_09800 [Desulfohalobiaceae bacterium]
MRCSEFRQKIIHWLNSGSFRDEDGDFAAHLRECELCRAYYSDVLLTRGLNEEPVPQPDREFADRVMDRAISRARRRRKGRVFRGLSAAAAVLMIFFAGYLAHFTTQHSTVSEQRHMEMALAEGDGDSIQILIETKRARQDATFTVALEGEVALRDLPDRRRMQWRTDLVRGRNLLELPVELRGESGGTVRVGYQYDSERQEVSVRVKPSDITNPNDGREI